MRYHWAYCRVTVKVLMLTVCFSGAGLAGYAQETAPETLGADQQSTQKAERSKSPNAVLKALREAKTLEERQAALAGLATFANTGDAAAQRILARELIKDQAYPDAIRVLGPLIETSDEEALKLASKVLKGQNADGVDPALLDLLMEKLVAQGDVAALKKVAGQFLGGQSAKVSDIEVRRQLTAAFEAGETKLGTILAALLQRGIGGAVDRAAALAVLQKAYDADEAKAAAPYADALVASGTAESGEKALEIYQGLAEAEASPSQRRAVVRLISGHSAGQFGGGSDPDVALDLAQNLLGGDDFTAALTDLLVATSKAGAAPALVEMVEAAAHSQIENGDFSNLNALFDHYAKLKSDAARAQMDALYKAYPDQLTADALPVHLISKRIDALQIPSQGAELLGYVDMAKTPSALERALNATRKNQNAFVYVLQNELNKAQLFAGPANGTLDKSTLAALTEFCTQKGITAECAEGPLKPRVGMLLAKTFSARLQAE